MAPRFRAEQIGSLLRPQELLNARASSEAAGAAYVQSLPEDVKAATQRAIASAVQKQTDLDIRPLTSGEYERHIFYSGLFEKFEGFEVRPEIPIPDGFRTNLPSVATLQQLGVKMRPGVIATGKIKWAKSVYGEEWEMLKGLVAESKWGECKITIPSPTWQHMQLAKGTAYTSSAYTTDKAYFTDLCQAVNMELHSLYAAGLRSIQIDDPNLTFFLTQSFLEGCREDHIKADELLDLYIWAHNQLLSNKPKNLHVGIHLCRGNMMDSTHVAEGSYERIAKKIFTELEYDTFYLEYESSRSGDFEPLRHLPMGKNVVLGVVSSKDPEMEVMEDLVRKVDEAADVIAKGQRRTRGDIIKDVLGVSPQCGFASMSQAGGKGMSESRMWEKLELVRDLARKIWGEDAI